MPIHFFGAPFLSMIWIYVRHSDLRGGLRRKGPTRAADFSWKRCGLETLRAFKETVGESGRTLSAASL